MFYLFTSSVSNYYPHIIGELMDDQPSWGVSLAGDFSAKVGGVPDKLEWLVTWEEAEGHNIESQR